MSYILTKEKREKLPDLIEKSKAASQIIDAELARLLTKSGLYFHSFSRIKAAPSLIKKLTKDPDKYTIKEFDPEVDGNQEPRITDLIGSRIVLYFQQDVEICRAMLEELFELDPYNTKIDVLKADTFRAVRTNLIFSMTQEMIDQIDPALFHDYPIAKKFEVQIRTTFSEGWHEVEHDVVYKNLEEWNQDSYKDSKRRLNALYATLEGCDSMMEMILDERATYCYANNDYTGMLRYKYHIRFSDTSLDPKIQAFFGLARNADYLKAVFDYSRSSVLTCALSPELRNSKKSLNHLIYITCALMEFETLKNTPVKLMKDPRNKNFLKITDQEYTEICDAVTRYLDRKEGNKAKINLYYRQLLYNEKMLYFSKEHSEEFADFFSTIRKTLNENYEDVFMENYIPDPSNEVEEAAFALRSPIRKDGFDPISGTYYYVYSYGDVLRKKSLQRVKYTIETNTRAVLNTWDRAHKINRFIIVINSKNSSSVPPILTDLTIELSEHFGIPVSLLGTYKLRKTFLALGRNVQRAQLGLEPLDEYKK